MMYLLITLAIGAAVIGWIWWAARHAPELYDDEQTHPPRYND